jgi:hypothetical protein
LGVGGPSRLHCGILARLSHRIGALPQTLETRTSLVERALVANSLRFRRPATEQRERETRGDQSAAVVRRHQQCAPSKAHLELGRPCAGVSLAPSRDASCRAVRDGHAEHGESRAAFFGRRRPRRRKGIMSARRRQPPVSSKERPDEHRRHRSRKATFEGGGTLSAVSSFGGCSRRLRSTGVHSRYEVCDGNASQLGARVLAPDRHGRRRSRCFERGDEHDLFGHRMPAPMTRSIRPATGDSHRNQQSAERREGQRRRREDRPRGGPFASRSRMAYLAQ